jgi:hypothetical protein
VKLPAAIAGPVITTNVLANRISPGALVAVLLAELAGLIALGYLQLRLQGQGQKGALKIVRSMPNCGSVTVRSSGQIEIRPSEAVSEKAGPTAGRRERVVPGRPRVGAAGG